MHFIVKTLKVPNVTWNGTVMLYGMEQLLSRFTAVCRNYSADFNQTYPNGSSEVILVRICHLTHEQLFDDVTAAIFAYQNECTLTATV